MANNNTSVNSSFSKNLPKYIDLSSWVIWYPDLFLDLIKPKTGAINLTSEQRVFMRSMTRFFSVYGCFPRGFGKTWGEVIIMFIVAMRYPNIDLALTAQTKDNAATLLKDKYNEIVKQYPMLENEIAKKPSFSKAEASIVFKNKSTISNLANSQNSKGQRKKRLSVEESVLIDNELFDDALKPIVEVSRYTCGKLSVVNPEELNQQINFFSTPGWRGSDEHTRNLNMIKNMINLEGEFVLGSDWMLGCWYGRGSSKSQILQKKKTMSPIAFGQNYGGKWTGSSDGALININNLMRCRVLKEAELYRKNDKDEYYIGVDVARSQNTNNNQSSMVVSKVIRDKITNRIVSIDVVNVINIPNILNFTNQAIIVKKAKRDYNAKIVIVDGNVIGSGLVDELLKPSYDPITKEPLGCWDTINTDNQPEIKGSEKCVYDLKAQGIQTRIITVFIDMIDSGKLRLLEKVQDSMLNSEIRDFNSQILPFVQTDLLFEEISNLKLKNNGSTLALERVVRKMDKDRFSALAYMLWYINEFESKISQPKAGTNSLSSIVAMARPPQIY